MKTAAHTADIGPHTTESRPASTRGTLPFEPPRRRWPGVLAASALGAGIAAVAVSSLYDPRSLGERIDATVATTGDAVQRQTDGMKAGAIAVAESGFRATESVASTLGDAGITAAVKTALTTDPSLSAFKIEVETHDGVVSLTGPAPSERARERAAVIAAAPEGVHRVDNRLVVSPPATVTR